MSMETRVSKKLKKLGFDITDKKGVTKKAVSNVIFASVKDGIMTKSEIVEFLEGLIKELKEN